MHPRWHAFDQLAPGLESWMHACTSYGMKAMHAPRIQWQQADTRHFAKDALDDYLAPQAGTNEICASQVLLHQPRMWDFSFLVRPLSSDAFATVLRNM